MMPRTTTSLVQGVLMDDYGPRVDGSLPDLTPFINSAFNMVNAVVKLAPNRPNAFMQGMATDTATLTDVETWLAAHFYVQSDQNLASKTTSGASGSFQGQTAKGLEGSKYGLHALRLDYSGGLDVIDKRRFAASDWIGKPLNSQIPWSDRN